MIKVIKSMKKIVNIGLVLMLMITVALAFPVQVLADTSNLTVNANGSQTGGTYVGGIVDYTNLNSNDDDTSYLNMSMPGNASQYHAVNFTDFATTCQSIDNVVFNYRARCTTSFKGYITPYVRISGINYYGTRFQTTGSNYTDYSYTWTNNPATGTTWTSTTLNAAQFGLMWDYNYDADAVTLRWTYTYVTVTYTPITAPAITTSAADDITYQSATLNGNITDDGGGTITNYGFVWDTTSRANPGNTAPAASAYANNWTVGAGTYSEGTIDHATGNTLTEDTVYYFRAAAYNSEGWTYGDEEDFETIGDPAGNTTAATQVANTTARLNGRVTDDNGQACDVRFGYGTTSKAAVDFDTYDTVTAWVTDTYATGSTPYVDVTSLTAGTPYYFRVQIRNDAGTVTGATEFSFTTTSGIDAPTGLIAIADATSIYLSWVKGNGASNTFVRYSTGTYPAAITDGTLAYSGTGNSVEITGLATGTTYFMSAWGLTAGIYSTSNNSTMVTTLAYSPGGSDLEPLPTTSSWVQLPDDSGIQNFPLLPDLIDLNADEFDMPSSSLWYFLWIIFSVGMGIILYNRFSNNMMLAAGSQCFFFGIGAILGLTMLWIIFALSVIIMGFAVVGYKY